MYYNDHKITVSLFHINTRSRESYDALIYIILESRSFWIFTSVLFIGFVKFLYFDQNNFDNAVTVDLEI